MSNPRGTPAHFSGRHHPFTQIDIQKAYTVTGYTRAQMCRALGLGQRDLRVLEGGSIEGTMEVKRKLWALIEEAPCK